MPGQRAGHWVNGRAARSYAPPGGKTAAARAKVNTHGVKAFGKSAFAYASGFPARGTPTHACAALNKDVEFNPRPVQMVIATLALVA